VSGYVASLGARPLEKGDLVEKGQVLARVRPGDHVQQVATARAQVDVPVEELRRRYNIAPRKAA
jgi:multidrug resistance efflux pump